MEQYGTETRLLSNQQYTVTFTVNGEPTELVFTSEYNPLFSSVRIIRSDFKELFAAYTDDEINRFIHDNSKLALEIANPEITADSPPYYAKQYVRYKTELDIIIDILVTLSTNGGAQEKLLGDLKISKEVKTPRLEGLIKLLEGRLATWELQLVGMKARPRGAVRSGASSEYPLNQRLF